MPGVNGLPMLPSTTNGVNFGALNPNLLNGAGLMPPGVAPNENAQMYIGPNGTGAAPNTGLPSRFNLNSGPNGALGPGAQRMSGIDPTTGQPLPTPANAQPGQTTVPNPAAPAAAANPGTAPNFGVTNPNSGNNILGYSTSLGAY